MSFRELFSVEVGFDPNNVFAALKSPLFHEFSSIFKVVCPCPKKDEGGAVADFGYVYFFELFESHS